MKINKKRFAKITSAVMAVVISSMLAFTAFGADIGYSSSWGNYTKDICSIDLSRLGCDTEIISVNKCFPNTGYSCFRFYKSSKVNEMNVWVESNAGQQMSPKYLINPYDEKYAGKTQIDVYTYYYEDVTFIKGRPVVFVGEQGNVSKKTLKYKVWSY